MPLCAGASGHSLALLIDHLQALPHDLVHSLLVALRAAYMEREADAPHSLVAVVTGGINLVGLSSGPTSPFNIAKPVVATPLTVDQSRALAEATLDALECSASANGMDAAAAAGRRRPVPDPAALRRQLRAGQPAPPAPRDLGDCGSRRHWALVARGRGPARFAPPSA